MSTTTTPPELDDRTADQALREARQAHQDAERAHRDLSDRLLAGDDTVTAVQLVNAEAEMTRTAALMAARQAGQAAARDRRRAAAHDAATDGILDRLKANAHDLDAAADQLEAAIRALVAAATTRDRILSDAATVAAQRLPDGHRARVERRGGGAIVIDGRQIAAGHPGWRTLETLVRWGGQAATDDLTACSALPTVPPVTGEAA